VNYPTLTEAGELIAKNGFSFVQNCWVALAIALVSEVPGYEEEAHLLRMWQMSGRLRFDPGLKDRATTNWRKTITLGPELLPATNPSVLGIAATLVHELFHVRQNNFGKTVSVWLGVFTRTDMMLRYERPAYRAATDFLDAVAASMPERAAEAAEEKVATQEAFLMHYGATLS
jgi:hypothetical protein